MLYRHVTKVAQVQVFVEVACDHVPMVVTYIFCDKFNKKVEKPFIKTLKQALRHDH